MQSGQGVQSQARSFRGPGAAAFKYDILTALMVTANHATDGEGRLAGRLALLITARFNWQTEQFAVGQKELAALWNVTERTVKREIGAMRALGWLSVTAPAARGRVARHRINIDRVLAATASYWSAVGPDFAARMTGVPEATVETNVIPLRGTVTEITPDPWGWHLAAQSLRDSNPAVFEAWIAALVPIAMSDGTLTLAAPSRFFADYVSNHYRMHLLQALCSTSDDAKAVEIVCMT